MVRRTFQILCLGIFFSYQVQGARPLSEPERIYNLGIAAENLEKWDEAVRHYIVLSQKGSPWDQTASNRIFRIINLLRRDGKDTAYLEKNLGPDLKQALLRLETKVEEPENNLKLSRDQILLGLGFLVAALCLLIYSDRRAKKNVKKTKPVRTWIQRTFRPKVIPPTENASIPEVFIHENTRVKIKQLLDLMPSEPNQHVEPPKIDQDGLSSSGLIDAFSKDFVSEVEITNSPEGKLSRMMIQADMIFDSDQSDSLTTGACRDENQNREK